MFQFYFYDIFFQKDFTKRAIFCSGKKNYESATKHESDRLCLNERPVTEQCLKISDPKTT